MKKLLALLLAAVMVLSMAACGGNTAPAATSAPAATDAPAADGEAAAGTPTLPVTLTGDYDTDSTTIYNYVLGEYKAAYDAALAAEGASEAWAMMAAAEAKLLEAGVMLPIYTSGGNYSISRVAPYTVSPVLYGNDQDRYEYALVATEFIKAEDRAEMKAKYGELKGTGEYRAWLMDYMTEKGYTLQSTYGLGYTSDPQTWDFAQTSRSADAEAIVNTLDALYWCDGEGTQQPALALSHTVSDDGLVYTFTLRDDAVWTDSQGRVLGPVTADDFVAGLQHIMDAMGGTEFLIDGKIKGVHEYISGETTDMADVGVKALDDHTVEYTLAEPCRYFLTMLGYNPFYPLNRAYYESQGGTFGADYTYGTYGTSPNNIAYCGPYLVTSATASNSIVFKASDSYYNRDAMTVDTFAWYFNDGSDVLKAYNDAKEGTLAGAGLNTSCVEQAKAEGLFEPYAYTSATIATSYMSFWNVNRAAFANVSDETVLVSPKTDEQKLATQVAMMNNNFRLALSMSWDRATYNAQSVGEELKLVRLRNSYTPGNFVVLTEETTIDINGTATTFPAGTPYGAVMQAQMDADGVPLKVFDPDGDNGAGSSDGFDGWYNPDNAKAYLAKAVEELKAQGLEISAENPIYIDYPYASNAEVRTNQAQAVKKSIEDALGGAVIVNLVASVDYDGWYNCGYYTDYGYEANYDTYDLSGWGPDYGDPSTYLDTFLPDYAGYMIKCIGIF